MGPSDSKVVRITILTVQVAGEGETSTATAAIAQRALELARPAAE